MGSLQDALLKTGLADEKKHGDDRPRKARDGARKSKPRGKPAGKRPDNRKPASGRAENRPVKGGRDRKPGGGSDLERAWVARRRAEQAEKERVKQARVADQEARRKRNLELDKIVDGRALNNEDADVPRYFEHLGRIRRVLCTPEQRAAINAGELGIVNLRGRYLIVDQETMTKYRALAEDLVPDLSGREPDGDADGDYPPVPDDITW